jgi:pimeloyl-ACP methyl ester carboxylesterase
LELGPVDVVGHSMGSFVAGFYGTDHPGARIASIDGFGPGAVTVGSPTDRESFQSFQHGMQAAFFAMTEPPSTGDRTWRNAQIDVMCATFPSSGYTAPNAREMAERNFVERDDGTFERRPPRHLFADAFEDDGDADVLRMYRHARGPTLIIRCTESGAPPVLDEELAVLTGANPQVEVVRMSLTHLAPAWDALEDVAEEIERFLARS